MPVYAIAIALLLDFILGDPAWRWHPVRVHGHLITRIESYCRTIPIPPKTQGAVFLVLNMFCFIVPISVLILLSSAGGRLLSLLTQAVLIYFALGGTCLAREVSGVSDSLMRDGVRGGRGKIRMLVSRDVDMMSEGDIVSSAIETLAENFSDSACATLLYAAIGGPVLAWIHRISNTLDAMVGYKTEEYADFGFASAKLDDILNFLPSRISALIIALVAPSVHGNISAACIGARSDGALLSSPNSGYPIAAFAGALGVKLCGPMRYFGELKDKPFIGHGPRPLESDLARALTLYWNAYALAAVASILTAKMMLI
ncbi:MAG: adenosylcobinamide-phosphate synthase CbiB [Synergistaceae bacterium]|nr:adenosylcobinamide-phosphate synthase CbiB [Synergistaceae bacterium]